MLRISTDTGIHLRYADRQSERVRERERGKERDRNELFVKNTQIYKLLANKVKAYFMAQNKEGNRFSRKLFLIKKYITNKEQKSIYINHC